MSKLAISPTAATKKTAVVPGATNNYGRLLLSAICRVNNMESQERGPLFLFNKIPTLLCILRILEERGTLSAVLGKYSSCLWTGQQ